MSGIRNTVNHGSRLTPRDQRVCHLLIKQRHDISLITNGMRRPREYPCILIEFREIKELGGARTPLGRTNVPINGLVRFLFFFLLLL